MILYISKLIQPILVTCLSSQHECIYVLFFSIVLKFLRQVFKHFEQFVGRLRKSIFRVLRLNGFHNSLCTGNKVAIKVIDDKALIIHKMRFNTRSELRLVDFSLAHNTFTVYTWSFSTDLSV